MKLLLDTQAFLWWADEPEKLSVVALSACQDQRNLLVVSVVSAWEMQIKIQLGKLTLKNSLEHLMRTQEQTNRVQVLGVGLDHIYGLAKLPSAHKDPFDRLIISQAISEDMVILSSDTVFADYPVSLLW